MWLKIKGWAIAIGAALLAVSLFALKFIGMGKKLEKAKTVQAQQNIEHQTQETLADEHAKTQRDLDQSRTAHDRGDFRDFNDDSL